MYHFPHKKQPAREAARSSAPGMPHKAPQPPYRTSLRRVGPGLRALPDVGLFGTEAEEEQGVFHGVYLS